MHAKPFLCLALLAAAAPLSAQTVAGEAVDPESGEKIPGAVVVLLDAAGAERASTLTDANGRFTLRARAAGRYTLRLERVGYTSATSPALALQVGQTLQYRLEAGAARVQLQGIVVTARSRCAARAQGGMEVALLWEEASKALRGTLATERVRPYRYLVKRYARSTSAADGRVLEQEGASSSAFLAKPFVSVPGARLEAGYVQQDGDGTVYYAPDADILTSPSFGDTHCFRVTADRERRGWIGLAFEPVRERRVPDIEGVMWLDSATAELRRLEYTYTGLPLRGPVARRLGGEVEFHRLPDGAWIVRSWRIRLPEVDQRQSIDRPAGQMVAVVTALREEGGDVTEIRTGAGELVRLDALGQLAGTVFDSTRAHPLAGATVRLEGTSSEATTDGSGTFVLRDLQDGEYTLTVSHPRLDSLEFDFAPERVSVRKGATARRDLAVPSLGTLLTAGCGAPGGKAALAGFVRSTEGDPLAATPVTLAWSGPAGADSLTVRADALGRYRFCGVPAGVPLELRTAARGATGVSALRLAADQRAHQDLSLDLPRLASGAVPVGDSARAAGGLAEEVVGRPVTGRLLDAGTGRPVASAVLRVGTLRATTGRDGRFAFESLLPGEYQVQVSHPSYPQRQTVFEVLPAAGTELEIRMAPDEVRRAAVAEAGDDKGFDAAAGTGSESSSAPQERRTTAVALAPIVATARPVERIAGVRRESGIRRSLITRDQIEKRLQSIRTFADLARTFANVDIVESRDARYTYFVTRGERVAVFIDGFLAAPDEVRNLQPQAVESIEFLPNGNARWANGPVMLVWTLTGERGSRRGRLDRTE